MHEVEQLVYKIHAKKWASLDKKKRVMLMRYTISAFEQRYENKANLQ